MKRLIHELLIVACLVALIATGASYGIGHKSSEQRALTSSHRVQSPLSQLP
jgi:hypothetical protein